MRLPLIFSCILIVATSLAACGKNAEHPEKGPPPGIRALPSSDEIDDIVTQVMQEHNIPGLALAVIENGDVHYVRSYGFRDLENEAPLNDATVMYGASFTKFVFATYVMQLAEEGLVDLDTSIAEYLPKPLPAYTSNGSVLDNYDDLAGDDRWRDLTLRILLSHQTGFPNYRFFPPGSDFDAEGKLAFFYDPGERYGYSGEGYYIAQLVVEQATGLNTGVEMRRRIFNPLQMNRTGLIWRDFFAPNISIAYNVEGERLGHRQNSNVRAAGSMDTSITDFSNWLAAFMRGETLPGEARSKMLEPQIAITSSNQFPPLVPGVDRRNKKIALAAGIGVVTWTGDWGPGFFKGGHSDGTDNILVCLENGQRCVVLLCNTAKGDKIFPQIVDFILGDTGMPWRWEYSSLDVKG